jgi:hypothetical protein
MMKIMIDYWNRTFSIIDKYMYLLHSYSEMALRI